MAQVFMPSGPGALSDGIYSKAISISCSVAGGHFWLVDLRGIVAVDAGAVGYSPFNKWSALSSASLAFIYCMCASVTLKSDYQDSQGIICYIQSLSDIV
jgi:hypothetical protein